MLQLYDYQEKTVNATRLGFKNHLRQLMVLPTGGGKTVVFTTITVSAARKGTKVLILTDRTELHNQTIDSLKPYGIKYTTIDSENKTFDKNSTVFIAMVETFKRRFVSEWENIGFGLIICDEAHMGNFTRIFDLLPTVPVIGATATPVGKHLIKYYTNIIQEIDTPELVERGYLVPCRAYMMKDDFSDLEKSGDEFTEQSNFKHFNTAKLYDGLIDEWKKKAFGLKTIVFCVNIEHTIKTYNKFKEAGISCEFITSKTGKETRNRILADYKNNRFLVLINCGILTKGFNEPSIECVIVNRATNSTALWLQMVGRGSRTFKGKKSFLLLDFGGNHTRPGLGLWNSPRFWTLDPPKAKKEGLAPCKSCSCCDAIITAVAKKCDYCEFIFPIKEKEPEKAGVMVEVKGKSAPEHLVGKSLKDLSVFNLFELDKSKAVSSSLIWRVIRSKGSEAVHEFARMKGFKQGWVLNQLKELDNSKFNNMKL